MNDKQLVAIEAAKLATNGMVIGLGTGSTANYFIEALAGRQTKEGLNIQTVASSTISAIKAQNCGKGRGQDLVMEKLLATAAKQFVVVADKSKLVSHIGEKFVIPIEVMPSAWQMVKHQLEKHGATGDIRLNAGQDNVATSAQGNYILDMKFPLSLDDKALNDLLNATPGVVEHGVFYGLTRQVLIADNGQIELMSL